MPSSRPSKPRPHTRRLRCESLEDRRVLAVYTVDSIEDSGPGTLREAIDLANNNEGPDEIVFDSAVFSTPQAIAIDSQLPTVTDPLTITGPGSDLLALDGQHGADGEPAYDGFNENGFPIYTGFEIDGWRILEIGDGDSEGIEVRIAGLTVRNADVPDGSAVSNNASLTLVGVAFEDNHSAFSGGAVNTWGRLTVAESQFSGNSSSGAGGAIASNFVTLTVRDSEFKNSWSDYGGAIAGRDIDITSSVLSNNFSITSGGAVGAESLTLTDSHIVDNRAQANGGGVLARVTTTVARSVFNANRASENGGAIHASRSNRNEPHVAFGMQIDASTFSESIAEDFGGALYLRGENHTDTITNSTFSGNIASEGSAINSAYGFTLSDSTVVDNRIEGFFGGEGAITVYAPDYPAIIDRSIIAGTTGLTSEYRGESYVGAVPDLSDGNGRPSRTFTVTNSLVGMDAERVPKDDYFSQDDPFAPKAGLMNGVDGNLVGHFSGSVIDPLLSPLGYNGGPTPTRVPMPGSPVIDAGGSVDSGTASHDQRGVGYHRVVGEGIDIGAVEAQGTVTAAPGDFNADGRFDAADYSIWRDTVGQTVTPLTGGDATGDGLVDEVDRALWQSRYGERYLVQLTVNSLDDDDDGDITNGRTTLREAIYYARDNPGYNEITFDPSLGGGVIEVGSSDDDWPLGYYPSSGPLSDPSYRPYYQIESALTIDARMVPGGITLDAGERWMGLHINAYNVTTSNDFDVTLAGLTIKNGIGAFGGGGAVNSLTSGTLTLIETTMIDNDSGRNLSGTGGAIYAEGPVTLIDSTIDGARSGPAGPFGSGGGVFARGDIGLLRSHIDNVETLGSSGAAVTAWQAFYDTPSTITLIDSSITNSLGGGVATPGDIRLERSTLEGGTNAAITTGGLLSRNPTGNVTLVDSLVRGFTSETANLAPASSGISAAGSGIIAAGDVSLTRSRVENNTITNDRARQSSFGGGIFAIGSVELVDSVVAGNSAGRGGGIYAEGRGENGSTPEPGTLAVSLLGSAVDDNTSHYGGSGIQSLGSIRIEQSSVSRNTSLERSYDSLDAAVLYSGYTPEDTFEVIDSVVAGNRFVREDGSSFGTYALGGMSRSAVTLIDSHVIDNEANGILAGSVTGSVISRNEGTGVVADNTDLTITGSMISGNRIGVMGTYGAVRLIETTVRGNRNVYSEPIYDNTNGAGVVANYVYLDRSTIAENVLDTNGLAGNSDVRGAGIAAINDIFATDSTIRDNHTRGTDLPGGGITADWVSLHRTTVSGNTTEGLNAHGGGIYAVRGVTLTQSTVSGNHTLGTESHGGGIYAGVLEARSSTIADNTAADASSEGGGVFLASSQLFYDTIVAGNTATVGPDVRSDGVANQVIDHSLVGDTSGFVVRNAIDSLLDIDPLLGPLDDNGGPTRTHALLPGSPAINAGDPERDAVPWTLPAFYAFGNEPIVFDGQTDQRGEGFPRVTDGGVPGVYRIDIGAVEFPGETAPIDPPPAAIAPLATRTRVPYSTASRATFDLPAEASGSDLALLLISNEGDPATEDDHPRSTFDAESEPPSDETLDEALAEVF